MKAEQISNAHSNQGARGCLRVGTFLFGLFFLAAGLFAFWLIVINPLMRWNRAKSWSQADCKILSSKIQKRRDDDGIRYKAKIEYQYQVGRTKHQGDQIDFMGFSDSQKVARKFIKRWPAGSESICYFDPDNHADAVLIRSSPLSFWMLFPLPFIAIGSVVIYLAVAGRVNLNRRSPALSGSIAASYHEFGFDSANNADNNADNDADNDADNEDKKWSEPQRLAPKISKIQKLIFVGLIAVFWNGMVGGFFPLMIIGLGVFALPVFVPFVLAGLGLIAYFFHTLLSLFNPKVEIAMSSGAVALGDSVDIAWKLTGKVNRIKKLKISIVGTESATYVRGTDTRTDAEEFSRLEVVSTDSSEKMEFGQQTITIPFDSMHTFKANNNEVAWSIEVDGDIPMWPDVSESFSFRVKPVSQA